jgi:hypothetical protein
MIAAFAFALEHSIPKAAALVPIHSIPEPERRLRHTVAIRQRIVQMLYARTVAHYTGRLPQGLENFFAGYSETKGE